VVFLDNLKRVERRSPKMSKKALESLALSLSLKLSNNKKYGFPCSFSYDEICAAEWALKRIKSLERKLKKKEAKPK